MVIMFNRDFNEQDCAYITFCSVYGIGIVYSKYLCSKIGLSTLGYIDDLTVDMVKDIVKRVNTECFIDRELQSSMFVDIQNKVKLKTYQGMRHLQGLPVNGQNTKNNSKTAKKLLGENAKQLR